MSLDAGRVGVRADQVDVHGRVTSPSFLNELLEDLPEWTDMPVWVNGTEELLPSNNSVPVTSPILADIAYPDIRRDNQYFTYRESPTPVDGLAKIKSIKGNTLVWNQLSQSDRANGTAYGLTFSCTGGLWSFQGTYTGENGSAFRCGISNVSIPEGHKVLLLNTSPWKVRLQGSSPAVANAPQNRIIEATSGTLADIVVQAYGLTSGDTVNVQCRFGIIDLTVMFGETLANAIYAMEQSQTGSGVAFFKSLFPLDYYSYNQGSLLSFNGTGIKTVGKNQLNLGVSRSGSSYGVTISYDSTTQKITLSGRNTKTDGAYILLTFNPSANPKFELGETYVLSTTSQLPANTYFNLVYRNMNNGLEAFSLTQIETRRAWRFTVPSNYVSFVSFQFGVLKEATDVNGTFGVQIEKGSSVTSYEPYTSSTLSLPISTYFPTGMKSAGSAYDELTPSKAINRLALFEITSSNIQSNYLDTQNNQWLGYVSIPDIKQITDGTIVANIICNTLETKNQGSLFGEKGSAIALLVNSTNVRITISGISTFADMQTWLDNHETYFVYELATPVELPTLSLGD